MKRYTLVFMVCLFNSILLYSSDLETSVHNLLQEKFLEAYEEVRNQNHDSYDYERIPENSPISLCKWQLNDYHKLLWIQLKNSENINYGISNILDEEDRKLVDLIKDIIKNLKEDGEGFSFQVIHIPALTAYNHKINNRGDCIIITGKLFSPKDDEV